MWIYSVYSSSDDSLKNGCTPFFLMTLQIRQVSTIRDVPLFFIIRSAEIVSSSVITLSMMFNFPRFLERYWQMAAGVTPSFSAVSFWLNPKLFIMFSAISRLITGKPFHIMYSQGVLFINVYIFVHTYN